MAEVAMAGARPVGGRGTVLAAAGLILVLFLVSLDQTIVGTAMPRIIAELRGFERYAWVTTAYLLAETAVIPIVGKLGDLYGRKWITIAGVAVFLVGSVLCGVATGMTGLIVFRGLQGLGAGCSWRPSSPWSRISSRTRRSGRNIKGSSSRSSPFPA